MMRINKYESARRISKKMIFMLLALLLLLTGCARVAENDSSEKSEYDGKADEESTDNVSDIFGEQKIKLSFRDDDTFKVLVFSDIHALGSSLEDVTRNNIRDMIEREAPDLVIFNGDNTWQETDVEEFKQCVTDLTAYVEEKGIPWCHVFGNHDCEGTNVDKETQQEFYESFEHCISVAGPEDLNGIGNYILPVYKHDSEQVGYVIWALDSGQYMSDELTDSYMPTENPYKGYNGNYDYLATNQILWYYNKSEAIERKYGKKLPGLMAFHIPVQECYYASLNSAGLTYTGNANEGIGASPINSGMFAAVLERGDVKAMVFGHDHANDYAYDYCGVKLCAVSTVSPSGYWNAENAGARVFILKDDGSYETYMRYVSECRDYASCESLNKSVVFDFESYEPEYLASSFGSNFAYGAYPEEIEVAFGGDRGVDGSSALSVSRTAYRGDTTADNIEIKLALENPGFVGESKYLRVWMDLTGDSTEIDFRKADFGLVADYANARAFVTDNCNIPTDFWYLPEGSDTWISMKTDGDGCFGGEKSVKGYKGWFAFPLENMIEFIGGRKLTPETMITGVYFYGCYADSSMAGQHFYFDDFTLTDDYTVFD